MRKFWWHQSIPIPLLSPEKRNDRSKVLIDCFGSAIFEFGRMTEKGMDMGPTRKSIGLKFIISN